MATPKYIRAALACRMVNLDRVKFNDAVASGVYPCAPGTRSGSARLFTEADLLPLFYFARLTEFGITAGRAGHLACEMANATKGNGVDEADRFVLLVGTMTEVVVASRQKYPESTGKAPTDYDPDHEKNGTGYPGIGRVLFTVEFYVKHVREIIADRLAYEASIIGEDDPE